jgi:hypothetical protein
MAKTRSDLKDGDPGCPHAANPFLMSCLAFGTFLCEVMVQTEEDLQKHFTC